MFEKLKKKSISNALALVVILAIIGVVLIVLEFANFMAILNGHVKFEDLKPEEITDHLIVDASINANFGAFIEEYEENTKTHSTRTTNLYYVIWTGDEDAEDYRYMGIRVPVYDEEEMEEMAEATYYYEYSEPIEYSGAIVKMDDEEYGYFKDYFLASGFTEQDIEDWTLPYYINVGALTGGAAVTVYVILGVGILLIVIAIIRLILALKGNGLKPIKKELEVAGISESEAEYDYESARVFVKRSDIRIGRRLMFFFSGMKVHALPNDKLVWAYLKTTTHRTNGIKTGTTYEVILNTYEKKRFSLPVAKEAIAKEILGYIGETMPWVVLGYEDDLNIMYNRDYQKFLQLRYNNAQQEQF